MQVRQNKQGFFCIKEALQENKEILQAFASLLKSKVEFDAGVKGKRLPASAILKKRKVITSKEVITI